MMAPGYPLTGILFVVASCCSARKSPAMNLLGVNPSGMLAKGSWSADKVFVFREVDAKKHQRLMISNHDN
jgi:hypothetical protein